MPERHVRITPDNSWPMGTFGQCIPRSFLTADEIFAKEAEGFVVCFIVNIKTKITKNGNKSQSISPIRNSAGEYLVVICQP